MRNLQRALLAGSLGFAVSFVAACGGGAGLLSGDQAGTLQNQLNQVSSALSAGNCSGVRNATRSLVEAVASLPTTVNGTLRQDLDLEASQVSTLAVQQCRPVATTPTNTTSTATTAPTTTATTNTTTTSTTTTPTTTTSATTPTTTGTNSGSTGGGGLIGGGSPGTGGAAGGLNGNGNGNGN